MLDELPGREVGDRRRQLLQLTPQGDMALADAKRLIAEHEAHFRSRFSQPEFGALVASLRRIHRQF